MPTFTILLTKTRQQLTNINKQKLGLLIYSNENFKDMLVRPKTLIQKRALRFALNLVTKHGYKHDIKIPVHQLALELAGKGDNVSHVTIATYWKTLEDMGYLKREMYSRKQGVIYHLNRYALKAYQDCV